MPIYEYRCANGHEWADSASREESNQLVGQQCPGLSHNGAQYLVCFLPLRRKYSVSFAPVMQEHFNSTVGKPISDMKQFKSELSRASDAATERTGIPHSYVPVDLSEAKAAD